MLKSPPVSLVCCSLHLKNTFLFFAPKNYIFIKCKIFPQRPVPCPGRLLPQARHGRQGQAGRPREGHGQGGGRVQGQGGEVHGRRGEEAEGDGRQVQGGDQADVCRRQGRRLLAQVRRFVA